MLTVSLLCSQWCRHVWTHLMFCSFTKTCSIFFFSLHFLNLFSPLDFDTSILPICKDSLGWMFNKLDMNFDLLLDQSELSAIYLDKYELCMKPLFNSCDSFKDGKLSNNEWCYCFQKPEGKRGVRRREVRIFFFLSFFVKVILWHFMSGGEPTTDLWMYHNCTSY